MSAGVMKVLTEQVGRERGRRRRRLRELWDDSAITIDPGEARVVLEDLIDAWVPRCPEDLRAGFLAVVRGGASLREAERATGANRKRLALFCHAFAKAVRA